MHLLYIDESGTLNDPKQLHIVLAGVCIFEKQTYWLGEEMDKIAARFNAADPGSVELHGSPMMNGKKFWRQLSVKDRVAAIKDALTALTLSSSRVFACVIRKSVVGAKDPIEMAFEQLASRFDYFLRRLHKKRGDSQRGVMIFDKSTYETTIQNLATDFRKIGHRWDVLRNLAEVPLFIDSRASRLIQLADLVSYSIYRNYEQKDNQFFKIFTDKLDKDGGTIHGLCEKI